MLKAFDNGKFIFGKSKQLKIANLLILFPSFGYIAKMQDLHILPQV